MINCIQSQLCLTYSLVVNLEVLHKIPQDFSNLNYTFPRISQIISWFKPAIGLILINVGGSFIHGSGANKEVFRLL